VPDRFPPPGPSYLPALPVGPGSPFHVGISHPARQDDWWLAVLWAEDPGGVPSFRDLAPSSGPPPEPPLMRLGPSFAGALSGFILEEDGRLQVRLAPVAPPEDPARPWAMPAAIRAAFRFEPLRVGTMAPDDLTVTVLGAFARACGALGHP
jgi:hypothetical protein